MLLTPKLATMRSKPVSSDPHLHYSPGLTFAALEALEINGKESRRAQSHIISVSLTNLNSIIRYQE